MTTTHFCLLPARRSRLGLGLLLLVVVLSVLLLALVAGSSRDARTVQAPPPSTPKPSTLRPELVA